MSTIEELVALPEAELTSKFEEAVKKVKDSPADPNATTEQKLKVYGLFKQAKMGDNTQAAPWSVQFEAKAKHDAWLANKGKSKSQAMAEYVKEILK
mmetsp:Transcript_10842/g.12389  ORF Transcript_10842/g.12389 Transcript_10842/m.12389 type:complete len:96 (-) Transcript_10842:229-516(-)|eukprot:CAMPEP_0184008370 /NCGR_PEP_ID=MMETSP0954-20121128/1931_1 /TAXON_ID=627963 /ORGANISM="Aplanochytrium sp, Strain PBS07" /LENGTH=95 /DNA_ID=CAMNT_0026287463 /DNA_START=216 /DNA_END=503 /DNA_ORIENTATION=-